MYHRAMNRFLVGSVGLALGLVAAIATAQDSPETTKRGWTIPPGAAQEANPIPVSPEVIAKGKQIYVEGRLQTRQWDDKDGNKRYTTEIRGDRIVLLGGMGGGGGAGRQQQRSAGPSEEHMLEPGAELTDDDIPF